MKNNIITSKISIKLLLTIGFCFFLSILSSYLFDFIGIKKVITAFLFVIGVFVFSFILIVNREIIYIKYIAERVKKISHENLGSTIEIRGNDELAELSESINSMSRELKSRREREKEIEAAKDELISNVSHYLRTPLTSIIGYVDLLRRKEYENEEQFNEYINTIYHKSLNLQSLINELFEYTKLTTPGIKLNKGIVELGSLLEQLIGEYVPILNREGLEVLRDIPAQDININVDAEKLVRVFDNILANARKYSSKPSEINVSLHSFSNRAVVSISNKTEKNISENLDKLFEKFYRIDISRKDNEGSGLGLAIAKRIVELHDGRIWAEYIDGIITFNVELEAEDSMRI